MIKLVRLSYTRITEELKQQGVIVDKLEYRGVKKFNFYQRILESNLDNIDAIRVFQEQNPNNWN